MRQWIGWLLVGWIVVWLSGCGGSVDNTAGGGETTWRSVEGVEVIPVDRTAPTVQTRGLTRSDIAVVGVPRRFVAVAYFSDGSAEVVTDQAYWQSSDATIMEPVGGSPGLFQVYKEGTVTIQAEYGGLLGTPKTMTAVPGWMTLSLLPQNMTLPTGAAFRFKAQAEVSTGDTALGEIDATDLVEWNSSNATVATIYGGTLYTHEVGTTTIDAKWGENGASTLLTVTGDPIQRLEVVAEGVDVNGTLRLPTGATSRLRAVAIFGDGTPRDVSDQVNWLSLDPRVVTVDNGVVTAVREGVTSVTAEWYGLRSGVEIRSTGGVLRRILLYPGDSKIPVLGRALFRAVGVYDDGSEGDLTFSVDWNSSNPAVATVDAPGWVTGHKAGIAQIGAVYGGVVATRLVTVEEGRITHVDLTTTDGAVYENLALGDAVTYRAIVYYDNGGYEDVTRRAMWVSDNPYLLALQRPGETQIRDLGDAQVRTIYQGVWSNGVTAAVGSAKLTGVTATSTETRLPVGATTRATATGLYDDGTSRKISGRLLWSSSAPQVATIEPDSGVIQAVGPGTTLITAQIDGQVASFTLQVVDTKVVALTLALTGQAGTDIPVGVAMPLEVTARYDDGSVRIVTDEVQFYDYLADVVAVSRDGLVLGVQSGATDVVALYAGARSQPLRLNVNGAALTGIRVEMEGGGTSLLLGSHGVLRAYGTFSDGVERDLTRSVTWESSNPGVLSVAPEGTIRANGLGTAEIYAKWPPNAAVSGVIRLAVTN